MGSGFRVYICVCPFIWYTHATRELCDGVTDDFMESRPMQGWSWRVSSEFRSKFKAS